MRRPTRLPTAFRTTTVVAFTIDANSGVVTVAGAINREADGPSRNITIRATSADGSFSTDQVFSIAIVDANEFAVTAPLDTDATTNAVDEM